MKRPGVDCRSYNAKLASESVNVTKSPVLVYGMARLVSHFCTHLFSTAIYTSHKAIKCFLMVYGLQCNRTC